ncbi:MAG: MFS transporter [Haloechinothrix sp.]
MAQTTTSVAPPVAVAEASTRTSPRRRELLAATVGAMVESFDWSIYAVFAPFFAAHLFGGEGSGALLAAYAGFAVGFVARPVGSAVIGRISDIYGRRLGLTMSMSLIAAASLGLALLPTSATIGVWAAVLAVVLRLLQGLAYGGETPTVAAYITESAPPKHRFLFSAISYGGIIIGSLLAFGTVSIMFAVFGKEGLADGGWRWGFGVAAAMGLFAIWVRRCAPESEDFSREKRAHGHRRPAIWTVFRDHPWAIVTVFLNALGGTVAYYFGLLYLPVYAEAIGVADRASASAFMTVVLVVVLVAMLGIGAAADRFGVLKMMRLGFGSLVVLTVPLLTALEQGVLPFWLVAVVFGVLASTATATVNVFTGMLFPTAVRAVGVGIVGAATIATFGGTFPMLAEWLRGADLYGAIPFYVAACALGSFACTFTAVRSRCFAAAIRDENEEHPNAVA